MRNVHAVLLILLVLAIAIPATSQLLEPEPTAPVVENRREIPGTYTLGFYADEEGSSTTLKIPKDATEFDAWLGITGDSTRVFSGLAMAIELPYGVELGGPVVWTPRAELKTKGVFLDPGITVEFQHDCARQTGSAPVILGRVPLRILRGVNEAVITPKRHRMFGLSVELCYDDRAWPKPYAEPVVLTVKRKITLWDRITGLFD